MDPLGSRPLALILPGGAAIGAWQGGCLYGLVKAGLAFQEVLGTSAGALNGCAYFQDSLEEMREIWRGIRRSDFMALKPSLNPPGLLSQARLKAFLARFVDEARAKERRRCHFTVVSTDLAEGEHHRAEYSRDPAGAWDGPLLDHVLGSISVPFLWPPVAVEGGKSPRRLLVDGHVNPQLDLKASFDRGARDFLFVSVLNPSEYGSRGLGVNGYIRTLVNQLLKGQLDDARRSIKRETASGEARAFVFHPHAPLGIKPFAFEPAACRRGFDLGVEDAGRLLANPTPFRAS